jgi:hypothetical protein
MNLHDLSAPFNPDEIEWRVGATNKDKTKGIALAYITARAVMDRLDQICGPENWQCRYSHAGDKTVCEIAVRCNDEWVVKSNGAGDTDVEGPKGALSDAFKRAAVLWGIGRYLYSLDSPWVALEARGRSYVISKSELPRLKSMLGSVMHKAPVAHQTIEQINEVASKVEALVLNCNSLDQLKKVWSESSHMLKLVSEGDSSLYAALVELKDSMKEKLNG